MQTYHMKKLKIRGDVIVVRIITRTVPEIPPELPTNGPILPMPDFQQPIPRGFQ